ncbi:MAG: iron-containing alcohol dehydrogenase [Bacteroidales bacterium]|jgi:alcohol dehydrogenase YqhD (iron-dependent ADH family)|nr:iron-containing alcohol dehydrogenase [Bacteroidales bacterium]
MENFTAYNPTKVHFGKNVIEKLGETVNEYGKRVLLMYGKGSIQKNGVYDQVIQQLNMIQAEVTEYYGIKSNPLVDDVSRAAQLGKLNHVDVIVAVGGGSVIDSAKITGLSIANNTDPWAFMTYKAKPKSAIPVIAVLTLAATGTEMNGAAVLQNHTTGEKRGYVSPLMYPAHSFLDPEYTYSVPKNYTAYGIADLIAHSLEAYFGVGDAILSDRIVEVIIREAMDVAPLVLKEPNNYEYRARVMWAATLALNGLTNYGRKYGDWGVHDIGHNLSYLYDTAHGATLSIAYPAWLKLHKDRIPERIANLGKQLFGTKTADETIANLEKFFKSIDCPIRLSDINIGKEKRNEIVNQMIKTKIDGLAYKFTDEDREKIVDLML